MLLPNADAETLKREPASLPTKLLAGIVYYQIKKYLGGGCIQTHVVARFGFKTQNCHTLPDRQEIFRRQGQEIFIQI